MSKVQRLFSRHLVDLVLVYHKAFICFTMAVLLSPPRDNWVSFQWPGNKERGQGVLYGEDEEGREE